MTFAQFCHRISAPLLIATSCLATTAYADFPDKAITLVVPFSAGGPTDKIARDIAESMRKTLKQTVVVDNTVGAGGTIGTARVARATPDGYTLLVHHTGLSTAGLLYKNLGYKPDDLEFLGLMDVGKAFIRNRVSLLPIAHVSSKLSF